MSLILGLFEAQMLVLATAIIGRGGMALRSLGALLVILCGMLTPFAIGYASLHPGLYRYLTPVGFQRERQRLDRFAATSRTLGDFYLALSAFTASVRCGHSFPNPANQTPAVASALFGKPDRLPFAFAWLDRRMIVTADLGSGHHLPIGSEIVAIDGIGARDMLAKMLP